MGKRDKGISEGPFFSLYYRKLRGKISEAIKKRKTIGPLETYHYSLPFFMAFVLHRS